MSILSNDKLAVPYFLGLYQSGVRSALIMLEAAVYCGGWPPGSYEYLKGLGL